MDNTRVVEPQQTHSGKWRTCTSNLAVDFDNEDDAKEAAKLCRAAFKAGRADKAEEIRSVIGARN